MLRESLYELIAHESDIEVETVEPDPIELLAAVGRVEADVVIITLPETGDPGLLSHLLTEYPDLLVIALSPADESAFVYRQVITKESLEPLSEEGLLHAIRNHTQEYLRCQPLSAST
jgi:DNA-binding NarL/FixJ family response regulator